MQPSPLHHFKATKLQPPRSQTKFPYHQGLDCNFNMHEFSYWIIKKILKHSTISFKTDYMPSLSLIDAFWFVLGIWSLEFLHSQVFLPKYFINKPRRNLNSIFFSFPGQHYFSAVGKYSMRFWLTTLHHLSLYSCIYISVVSSHKSERSHTANPISSPITTATQKWQTLYLKGVPRRIHQGKGF